MLKLGSKLMVLFLLLSLVPLSVVGYLSYESGKKTIEDDAFEHVQSVNALKSEVFKGWIADRQNRFETTVFHSITRSALLDFISQVSHDSTGYAQDGYLENLFSPLLQGGGYLEIFILRAEDGIVIASTDSLQQGMNLSDSPYFMEGKKGTYIQNFYLSSSLDSPAMTIGLPIRDSSGDTVAVLAGQFDLSELSLIMRYTGDTSESEDTYLINNLGFFVTDPRFGQGYAMRENIYTEGAREVVLHKSGIGTYRGYRGGEVIGAYQWLPEWNLGIITEIDRSEALAPVGDLRNLILIIGGGIATVAVLLAVFFSRTVTRPIQLLSWGAAAIGRGDLAYRVDTGTRDEIGDLSREFDRMAQNLRETTVTRDSLVAEMAQRKGVERELRKSEALLTEAQRMSHTGNWEWDKETGAFETSIELRRMYGFSPERSDISIGEYWQGVHPDDRQLLSNAIKKIIDDGEGFEKEYRIFGSGGQERVVLSHVEPFFDESGNLKALLGTVQDITERKRMEDEIRGANTQLESQNQQLIEALREASEAKSYSESVIEAMNDAVLVYDTRGKTLNVNRAYEKLMGAVRQEVIGLPLIELPGWPADDRMVQTARERTDRIMTGDDIGVIEMPVINGDGVEISISASHSIVRDGEGNPEFFIAVIRDITERKRLEEETSRQNEELKLKTMELEAAREELRINLVETAEARAYSETLLRSFTDGLVMIDFDGIVRDVNEVYLDVFGFDREEIVGRPAKFETLVNQKDRELALESLRLAAQGIVGDDVLEFKAFNKHGTEFVLDIARYLVKDAGGNPFMLLVVIRDITERKRAEEKLREYSENLEEMVRERTRELEEAQEDLVRSERLATLGKFSGSLSHELRNPLGVIDSSAYYLKAKLKDTDPKLMDHLDRIKSAAGSATAIIQSVLDLTRMGDPKQEKVDLKASVNDAVDTSSVPDAVEVIRNLGEADIILDGDHEQLRMAFKNIIKNAVEAMNGEGKLEITLETDDNEAVIFFADNGSGIDPDHIEEVFQPLFSTKAKGIGFGLAITRMVAEKHHGSVSAESVPGKGTRVIVRLPLQWRTKEA